MQKEKVLMVFYRKLSDKSSYKRYYQRFRKKFVLGCFEVGKLGFVR